MNKTARILIAGDLFPTTINEAFFARGDVETLFDAPIRQLFREADYSVCNLEGVLTTRSRKSQKSGVALKADPETIRTYVNLGISLVSLANNHCLDYRAEGFYETVARLEENGIAWAGAGENEEHVVTHKLVEINGLKIIFYCVAETLFNIPTRTAPGVNLYDEYRVCKELEALKKTCDHLVVLYHGGAERFSYTTPVVRTRFQRMAESGADMILSQHTHAIGEEEWRQGTYCLYGQGNFLFHYTEKVSPLTANGLLLECLFTESGITVGKHVVKRVGPGIVYDRDFDMREFMKRSERLAAGDSFESEFRDYSEKNLYRFLESCRGNSAEDEAKKEAMSAKEFNTYLKQCYSRQDLLVILKYLEAEEFREYAIQGLKDLIRSTRKK